MSAQRPKGFAKASAFLDRLLASAASSPVSRVPPIAQLSREAGVSVGAMHRAVRQRVLEGTLTARHRSGIRIVSPSTMPVLPHRRPAGAYYTKVAWLTASLQRDITSGTYAPGALLPTLKELCGRHGAGFRTVRAALHALVAERSLVPWGRGYRVPILAASQYASAVLAVASGTSEYLQLVTERTSESLSTLERECALRNLAFRTASVSFGRHGVEYGDELQQLVTAGPAARGVLGVVLFGSALPWRVCEEVLTMLASCATPTAFIDEGTAEAATARPATHRSRVFALAYGETCGESVGRLLAQLGHRAAAFITAYSEQRWPHQRLRGVDAGLRPTGEGPPVRCVTIPIGGEALSRQAFVARTIRGSPVSSMHNHYPLARGLLWPEQQIQRLVRSYLPWEEICRVLDELRDDSRVTAWVADNDPTALVCLSYLASRGVRVPQEISLVGFDDGNLALVNNLTSYNFNCRTVMLAALQHILSPPPPRPGHLGPERVEIEGYIAQRATVGPARG